MYRKFFPLLVDTISFIFEDTSIEEAHVIIESTFPVVKTTLIKDEGDLLSFYSKPQIAKYYSYMARLETKDFNILILKHRNQKGAITIQFFGLAQYRGDKLQDKFKAYEKNFELLVTTKKPILQRLEVAVDLPIKITEIDPEGLFSYKSSLYTHSRRATKSIVAYDKTEKNKLNFLVTRIEWRFTAIAARQKKHIASLNDLSSHLEAAYKMLEEFCEERISVNMQTTTSNFSKLPSKVHSKLIKKQINLSSASLTNLKISPTLHKIAFEFDSFKALLTPHGKFYKVICRCPENNFNRLLEELSSSYKSPSNIPNVSIKAQKRGLNSRSGSP